ncbi:MAG: cysteine hydrolase [Deltaproteobacteria bacterium]|nr:cysteine hydrolase [Deltaproteobacteria bacterium]
MIFRNLREIVDPEHTALVVWDVQNALVETIFNKDEFLKNLCLLIKESRSNKIPVIYTKIAPLPKQFDSSWRLFILMQLYGIDDPEKLQPIAQPGSIQAEIPSEVSPTESDVIIYKHTPSIFIGTNFENMIRNRGINTILFTGIATEIGVDSSARDSSCRGFYTIVVEDCVSSSDKDMHESALRILNRRLCLVLPSKDIIKEWE